MANLLSDQFWSPRLETNARVAIFHQWDQLEASGCIDNFRIAAGQLEGFRQGWFFADSDAYKWLEAAARILAGYPNARLSSLADNFIALLAKTQSSDGYLFTYNQIHFPNVRWANLQIEHELYCHGHLIEAGVTRYQAAGKTDLLDIARRAADRIVHDFIGAGPEFTPGHEEIEIALLRLYQVTNAPEYLGLAHQFLEQRGRFPLFAASVLRQNRLMQARSALVTEKRQAFLRDHPDYSLPVLPPGNFNKKPSMISLRYAASALSGKLLQQQAPIRQQAVPVGHAVRFGYLQAAVAMLYRIRGDESLLPALKQSWERMVSRRMYLTGGVGSLPLIEGFGRDDELDPEVAYAETCAAIASLQWSWQMAQITREAPYSDLFEWQLYNAALTGMGLSGREYTYNNPLVCRDGVTRKPWFEVPCCPSNLSRLLASLGDYLCSTQPGAVWLHQYIGSQISCDPGSPVFISMHSGLPWDGKVKLSLALNRPVDFTLWLRIPSWAGSCSLRLNGQSLSVERPVLLTKPERASSGYDPSDAWFLPVRRTWMVGDILQLDMEMTVTLRSAPARVKGYRGKVAVTRGPLVYCLESVDNPGIDLFAVKLDDTPLVPRWEADCLGGCLVLRGQSKDGKELTFIPYHLWGNRGPSRMTVWVNI